MSPRSTKAFHQLGNFPHLPPVLLIGLQYGNLLGKSVATTKATDGIDQGISNGLGAAHSSGLELCESLQSMSSSRTEIAPAMAKPSRNLSYRLTWMILVSPLEETDGGRR